MGASLLPVAKYIYYCKEKELFLLWGFRDTSFSCQQNFSNEVYRNYRAPMMDSLSTELIAQLYRNPSEINRWQTVVMNAILFWYWIWNSKKKKNRQRQKRKKQKINILKTFLIWSQYYDIAKKVKCCCI